MGTDGLEGLFDTAVTISAWYATIATFKAAETSE